MTTVPTSGLDQSFLHGLGLAGPPADDPALWIVPERGGFADGFAATVDDLFGAETAIDQGQAMIAERKASGQSVPSTWTVRLTNLTTKRLALRGQLTEKHSRAVATLADCVTRLNRQEAWFAAEPSDSRFTDREDVFLVTLAVYERLALALDRAFETIAETTAADPDAVAWTTAWAELRALGFAERGDVEVAIGGWDNDPREVVRRAKAVRPRGFVSLSRPSRPNLPPVSAVPVGTVVVCHGCGGERTMGVPCPACGALPVVAHESPRPATGPGR